MRLHKRSWLVELRKQRGLTQAAIASACGVKRQAITAWESGEQAPSRDMVFLLAEQLGDQVLREFAREAVENRRRSLALANEVA